MSAAFIHVGLILDSFDQPAWVEETLKECSGIEGVSFVAVLLKGTTTGKPGHLQKAQERYSTFVYRLYMRADKRLCRGGSDPFPIRNVLGLLSGAEILTVQPERSKHRDAILEDDVSRLRGHAPDVILHFGHRILSGSVLDAAPLGVWSLHHGDDRRFRGGPPGFWEVFRGDATAGVILQKLSSELDAGPVIARSVCNTHRWSVFGTRRRTYWAGVRLVMDALRKLAAIGTAAYAEKIEERNCEPRWYCGPLYRPPGNARMLGLLARHAGRAISRTWNKAFFGEQWVLLYRRSSMPLMSPRALKVIEPPKGMCWADPHGIVDAQGRTCLFFEEFASGGGKGRVALLILDESGRRIDYRTVIEEPWHLSYPFVFEWAGSYWMLPESSAQGQTTLYRAVEFPYKWEPHRQIMPGVRCYDPTLHEHEGRWWLFVTIPSREGLSSHQDLHLFHADRPDSDTWIPHRDNPVISDVTRARSAGPLFRQGDKLYRPSQDCSRRYGYGVRINEVEVLNQDSYREREVGFLEPQWDPRLVATHTYSFRPGLTVMDARRRTFLA